MLLRCHNAYGRIMQGLKVRHTKNQLPRIETFLNIIAGFTKEKEQEAIYFQKLSEIKIDAKILDSLANRLLNIDEKAIAKDELLPTATVNRKGELMNSLIIETKDLGMNLFGAFNGMTHYTTHVKKSTDIYGNLLGGNQKFTDDGFKVIQKMALELA